MALKSQRLALTRLRIELLKAQLREAVFWETHHTWTNKTVNRIPKLKEDLRKLRRQMRRVLQTPSD